jgi:hypothetical protein
MRAKRPGHGVNHLPPSSTEVKERAELYLYSLSVLLWQVVMFQNNLLLTSLHEIFKGFLALKYFVMPVVEYYDVMTAGLIHTAIQFKA